ncbi:MAG: tyrosine-type recombinase/integrase [Armatimonadota bacterium]
MRLSLTVADTLHAFLLDRKLSNLSPRTLEWYERRLHDFLQPLLDTPVGEVTEVAIKELIVERVKHVATETVNGDIRATRAWAYYCLDEELGLNIRPRRLKQLKVERKVPHYLTDEQVHQLLVGFPRRTLAELRDYCVTTLMLDTGLRLNECLSISSGDVEGPYVVVRAAKGGRQRVVQVSPPMQEILRRWLKARQQHLGKDLVRSAYLFPSRLHEKLNGSTYRISLKKYAFRAGVEARVSPHDLRRTYANACIRNGMGAEHLRKSMGWTSMAMAKHYIDMDDASAHEASVQASPIARLASKHGPRGDRRGRRRATAGQSERQRATNADTSESTDGRMFRLRSASTCSPLPHLQTSHWRVLAGCCLGV